MTALGSQGSIGCAAPRPALFTAYPRLAAHIAHLPLGDFPTAIERIPGLLPGGCELWVKREDRAGLRYGGNKVRKLEFLLADAKRRGAGSLITIGGLGSNHVLATAIYGAGQGLSVDAVLFPQPIADPGRAHIRQNLLAGLAAGLRPHVCRSYAALSWTLPTTYLRLWRSAKAQASALTYVSGGGSSAIGTLGWWSGGLEITQQIERGEAPRFDAIYLALGSGGTTAGLLLGLGGLVPVCSEIVAVRVVPWPLSTHAAVQRLAGAALQHVGAALDVRFSLAAFPRLRIESRFLGRGYGHSTPEAQHALSRAADLGLRLDPTYTAKAFSALWADDQAGRLRGKRVLFLHTYSSQPLAVAGDAALGLRSLPAWLAAALDRG